MIVRRLAVLALLLSACAHQPATFNAVDAAIEKELASGIPSIAVAIAKNGRIVHEAAFGFADEGVRATVHTPYPLASVTKPMVATSVMVLAERKLLDLDQPASKYAAGFVPATHTYTVRQLLNHTSGLPTYATIRWNGEAAPPHDAAEMFRRYGFAAHPPGVVSEYSNIGYGLLGRIVAEQSGRTLSSFLTTELFAPLGMRNTHMLEGAEVPRGFARKYDAAGKPLPQTHNDTPGAGNVYGSVHDLVRFGMFHLHDRSSRVLSPASKRLMRTYVDPHALYPYYDSTPYALGWYIRDSVVWHEGGMPGASSILVLLPEHGIAAAVVINANDRNDVAQRIVNTLINAVEPKVKQLTFDPTAGFVPYDAQPAFLGKWEGTVTIDGKPQATSLTFEPGGTINVSFPQASFKALVNGDLLLGTFAATLPASDVRPEPGYVLGRLVRRGDALSGTMIAYASPEGLRHLYPFAVTLRRAR